MRADELMAEAMRSTLESQARKLTRRLRKAKRGDAEGVHDSRSTLRFMREGLAIMGRTVFEASRCEELARGLRDVERALGKTRDDDVLLEDLDRWLRRVEREARYQLAPLRECIAERRTKHARSAARKLRRKCTREAVMQVHRWLRGRPRDVLPNGKDGATAVRRCVRHFVFDQTWRAYEEILAYGQQRPPSIEVIHNVRSSCRRLRFTLEIFQGVLAPQSQQLVAAIHALQNRLGDLHDAAVATARVERFIARGKVESNEAVEAYLARRKHHRDRLHAEFDREWNAIDAAGFRMALFRALGDGGEPREISVELVSAA
ncbi:MAG TPA: CHAD domain-containing protein [Polyangiaceae bacterium]|nr:CHAD domain-containing protein [Polyangiaceae bacterium]